MKSLKNITISVLLFCIMFMGISGLFIPKQVHAQWAVFDAVTESSTWGDFVTNVDTLINSNLLEIKAYILDPLAWALAKALVQDMTASTVNWINGGFHGSPSFITNPSGYFADAADQMTGAFISDTGILSGLCSPFNIDVRLSIALGAVGYGESNRYTCTLNSVINNVKNSTIDGASIGGFMNGDFKQGGWPAFIALSQSSNNSSGVYLQAHSDLLQQTGEKKSSINQTLLQGSGFLPFQDCKDISTEDVSSLDTQAQNNGNYGITDQLNKSGNQNVSLSPGRTASGAGATSIQKNVDKKTGNVSYQSCETKTPGSVIAGSINKSLGASQDSLVTASQLDEVIGALMGQLVKTVLTAGLSAVSQKSSDQTQSFIDQLAAQNQPGLANISGKLQTSITSAMPKTIEYKNIKDQILGVYINLSSFYKSVIEQCSGATTTITSLQSTLDNQITPLLNAAQVQDDSASSSLQTLYSLQDLLQQASSTNLSASSTNDVALKFSDLLQSGSTITAIDISNANTDLTKAQKAASRLKATATRYQLMCIPLQTTSTGVPIIEIPSISYVDIQNNLITGQNFTYTTDVYIVNKLSNLRTDLQFIVTSSSTISTSFGTQNIPLGDSNIYVENPNRKSNGYYINFAN